MPDEVIKFGDMTPGHPDFDKTMEKYEGPAGSFPAWIRRQASVILVNKFPVCDRAAWLAEKINELASEAQIYGCATPASFNRRREMVQADRERACHE